MNDYIDFMLQITISDNLFFAHLNEAPTLKEICGYAFWKALNDEEKIQFGIRFRWTCQNYFYEPTDFKRHDARVYIKIN